MSTKDQNTGYYAPEDFYPGAAFVMRDFVDDELGCSFMVIAVMNVPKRNRRRNGCKKSLVLMTSYGTFDIGRNTEGWPKDSTVKIA